MAKPKKASGSKEVQRLRKALAREKAKCGMLERSLRESRAQHAATAEILEVMRQSPADTQPVFDAIVKHARRLIGGHSAAMVRRIHDQLHLVAQTATTKAGDAALKKSFPAKITGKGAMGKAVLSGKPASVADLETDPAYSEWFRAGARKRGYRSLLAVPMLRDGSAIGGITVTRRDPGAFRARQIGLLKAFADQAVIAIENVRRFNETKEALERQTATGEILDVIARSPGDVQPVLDAVAENAARLCGATDALILTLDAGLLRRRAHFGPIRSVSELRPLTPHTPSGRAILERRTLHIHDILEEIERGDYPEARELQRGTGFRTMLSVPLVREDNAIGVIAIRRLEVRPFTQTQIALVKTFADQAVIAIENVRLFNETKEALERQTATAEILKVIGSSPTATQPVFDAIVQAGLRLFPGATIGVTRPDGDRLEMVAVANRDPAVAAATRARFPIPLTRDYLNSAAILDARVIDVVDAELEKEGPFAPGVRNFLATGNRAMTVMPMLRGEEAIGTINVTRPVPGSLSEKQVALLRIFADQAVIAIENVRLFNETKEALEHQQASAEILRIVSQSVANSQPVFDAILAAVGRLFPGFDATVWRVEHDRLVAVARGGPTLPSTVGHAVPITRDYVHGIAVLERRPIRLDDIASSDSISEVSRQDLLSRNRRALLMVPLVREGDCVGAISVSRSEPYRFVDKQVAVLKTFADQAVIAIENTRLFNETKDALERQTATAEILKVISSSPTSVQPVFQAIVDSALRLLACAGTVILRREGDAYRVVAMSSADPAITMPANPRPIPIDPSANFPSRVFVTKTMLHIPDWSAVELPVHERGVHEKLGVRSSLMLPLLRDDECIGVLAVLRAAASAYTPKEIALMRSFADQAVIAIENTRLFNETKQSLERQTATAEILKVIASSPSDVQPVFEAIAHSAQRLLAGNSAHVARRVDDVLHLASHTATTPAGDEALRDLFPAKLVGHGAMGKAILSGNPVCVTDFETDPAYSESFRKGVRNRGYRSQVVVPMLREGQSIGAIAVTRAEPGSFSDHQVNLLRTFADQAVIAIENTRLFKELEERTQALTRSVNQLIALGEVGQAISSTLDLDQVLKTIAAHAVQLTGLDVATIYEFDEATGQFELRAWQNMPEDLIALFRQMPIRLGEGVVGNAAALREPVQVPDIQEPSYQTRYRDLLIRRGYRAILAVPMLREDRIIGGITVSRSKPGEFPVEVVELLKTFATQSAMAIQNARLFREIAEKSRQLEEASKHKSQFLASMSHELRTPLNAILGFNEMLLGEVYGPISEDMQPPLAQMQTSGKHLLRLINNVLDLAKIEAGRMELALSDYSVHDTVESVRATLRPLAEAKGLDFVVEMPADLPLAHGDPGRITQCLMNLAGNSLKFTKEGKVAIQVDQRDGLLVYRVTDTGIGIPADKIGNLFTEFKQTDATIASEFGGTGLGLSISKKFIEMHGGRIWAESAPGQGSTFIFEIPVRAREGDAA